MRASAFVRKGAGLAPADPGTRPGLYGQTLLSSGQVDLDRLLGGGLPLGALLLVLEDGTSSHHATLLRLFLGEGLACGQPLLLAAAAGTAPEGGLPRFLPQQAKPRSAEREVEGSSKEQDEFKLRIAWQYRRYIKGAQSEAASGSTAPPSMGSSSSSGGGRGEGAAKSAPRSSSSGGLREWCHQFDLTRPAGEDAMQGKRARCVECSSVAAVGPAAAAFVLSVGPAAAAGGAAAAAAAPAGGAVAAPAKPLPHPAGRLAVLSLGSPNWQLSSCGGGGSSSSASGREVLRALLQIKASVREQRCVAAVSLPAALFAPSDLARMQHLADAVIALESVTDDSAIVRLAPDPGSVAGLLHLRRLPCLGAVAAPVPEASLHLLRHRRRRISITPVEVDPAAEAAEGAAAAGSSGGGSKGTAGILCAPGPAGSPLDF